METTVPAINLGMKSLPIELRVANTGVFCFKFRKYNDSSFMTHFICERGLRGEFNSEAQRG